MRRPSTVIYGVDERPPALLTVVSGLQHVALMSTFLLFPVLIAKASDSTPEVAAAMVSVTLIAMAAGTMVQVIPIGPFGSGYLCQPIPSIVYLIPSLAAARAGGLALVFGMTVAAGLMEILLSRLLRRLRPIFPPEIVGLVILLVGVATGLVGLRLVFGETAVMAQASPAELFVGTLSLGLMVGLNIWGGRYLRSLCVLIGMTAGYVAAALLGSLSPLDLESIARAQLIALPNLGHVSWTIDTAFAASFMVAAIAATLKVIGDVTTAQKANDADWVRADMKTIGRGVLSDGVGTVFAGAIGAPGLNSCTPSVGLATATGVLSRYVAYPVAALLFLLAFFPKLGALFYLMPRMVIASALVFSSAFIIVNGMQVMTSRLLDARKIIVIGLALLAGIAVDAQPGIVRALPDALQPVLGTSLVLGTVLGLVLILVFRIGTRRTLSMFVPLGAADAGKIEAFLQASGEAWGARVDVIERTKFNLVQSIETILEACNPEGPLQVDATFDEFSLDIRVSYTGPLLELPERRPTNEEIMETEEGQRRLAGFMLRRHADRVSSSHKAGRSTLTFHFDH